MDQIDTALKRRIIILFDADRVVFNFKKNVQYLFEQSNAEFSCYTNHLQFCIFPEKNQCLHTNNGKLF